MKVHVALPYADDAPPARPSYRCAYDTTGVLEIDNVMMTKWFECPRAFFWAHVAGIAPRGCASAPMWFGIAYHKGLQWFYENLTDLNGQPTNVAIDGMLTAFRTSYAVIPPALRDPDHTEGVATDMYTLYLARLAREWRTPIEVHQCEVLFTITIAPQRIYIGRMDLLCTLDNEPTVVEWKTTAQALKWWALQWRWSNKILGYGAAMHEMGYEPRVIVEGHLVYKNLTSPKHKSEKFTRTLYSYRPEQIQTWRNQTQFHMNTITKALDETIHMGDSIRRRHTFPMNCGNCHRWRTCAFIDLCELDHDPTTIEGIIETSFKDHVWDPQHVKD